MGTMEVVVNKGMIDPRNCRSYKPDHLTVLWTSMFTIEKFLYTFSSLSIQTDFVKFNVVFWADEKCAGHMLLIFLP